MNSNIISEVAFTANSESFLKKWNESILQDELWPFPVSFSCCASELRSFRGMQNSSSYVDVSDISRPPEKADLLIVGGTISQKIAPHLIDIYERMPEEKWVLAVGACASSGGPYWTHNVVQGLSQIIPVDVYLPGCPPSKEMIIQSFEAIRERVAKKVSALSQTRWSLNV
ncbi:MAG: NADH-quinone oxidoreductase subunit B [Halobacteriovorax sp.]|nr:NADH-quinone oxidoreductase subunit B [Halobacteriovorax sp.]|tara:strand:+ start:32363 stop:32872 length:510 start_codon:yes stop_codon:yes gene_type:complete